MTIRKVIPFLIVIIALFFLSTFFYPAIQCSDPAGCLELLPGEPLQIGFSRITSGPGQTSSIEIQQSAELAATHIQPVANHRMVIQPFYTSCIPETVSNSTIEMAGTTQLLTSLGPDCPSGALSLQDALARTAKPSLDMTQLLGPEGQQDDPMAPVIQTWAQQSAAIIKQSHFSLPIVTANPDQRSQAFKDAFCLELSRIEISCLSERTTTPTSSERNEETFIYISLENEIALPSDPEFDQGDLPKMIIALSNPQKLNPDGDVFTWWIGPVLWSHNAFGDDYHQTYQSSPETLSAWITYQSIPLIYETAQQSSRTLQDGSWIISRQEFQKKLTQNFASFLSDALINCNPSGCPLKTMSLFRWSGNEYVLANP